jgi:hypothetical protein
VRALVALKVIQFVITFEFLKKMKKIGEMAVSLFLISYIILIFSFQK